MGAITMFKIKVYGMWAFCSKEDVSEISDFFLSDFFTFEDSFAFGDLGSFYLLFEIDLEREDFLSSYFFDLLFLLFYSPI